MPTKLGQNFLVNKEIVEKIIQAANLKADDFVLEVGPGKGILTEQLAKLARKVIAVEIDTDLTKRLDSRFRGNDKVKIINDDILKINLINLIDLINLKKSQIANPKQTNKYKLQTTSYKLIANLPYYITSPIIRKFLELESPPKEMILMVQKEVAERIVAKPGKMSILAVSVQYYAQPEIIFYVGKENFDPEPEVDSAVIKITHNQPARLATRSVAGRQLITYNKDETKKFFQLVRAGFSAKRKTLANNLANGLHIPKKEAEEKIKTLKILPTARAQELSIEDWKQLTKLI